MSTTTVLTALLTLLVGLALGWFLARRHAAEAQGQAESRDVADARLDASTARAEASRAREETAAVQARLAAHLSDQADLRAQVAEALREAAAERAAAADTRALLAAEKAERRASDDRLADALHRVEEIAADREAMAQQFKVLSEESLEKQGAKADKTAQERMAATAQLVTPLAQGLEQLNARLTEVEKERAKLSAELGEQISAVRTSSEHVRREALSLSSALRTPQVRGSWGEQSLRRLVEISGLTNRCDFDDQQTYTEGGDRFRPDMRINLADGKVVFVDSKVPLAAVLEAYNTEDEEQQRAHLATFARHVRTHIDQLSGKNYWQLDLGSPEFVVLFLGSDEFYRLAQEQMPDLHEYAARRKIMVACPGTLIPLLHAVAHGWKQAGLAESAAKVSKLGRELYDRLSTMGEHFDRVGRGLTQSVNAYNKTIGALETRVMVSARRFRDLEVTSDELKELSPVEASTRDVAVPEMVEHRAQQAQLESLLTVADSPELDLTVGETLEIESGQSQQTA